MENLEQWVKSFSAISDVDVNRQICGCTPWSRGCSSMVVRAWSRRTIEGHRIRTLEGTAHPNAVSHLSQGPSSLTYNLLCKLQGALKEREEIARMARLASKYCENCKADRTPEGFLLKNCPLCDVISYCSEACQHMHWKVHLPLCKELRIQSG